MKIIVDNLVPVVGALVLVLLGLQALLAFASTAVRLRGQKRQAALSLKILGERLEAARVRRVASEEASLGWNGWRKFTVMAKVPEGGDICSFYLYPHDKKKLPPFKPGQFITFNLDIPGQPKPVVRCYSLSDAPCSDCYRVSIKRCAAPPDKPGIAPGLSSTYFHDVVKEGDILDVRAPSGGFWLDPLSESPVVLIGGGVGITPVMSMLNTLTLDRELKREVWFFFGGRNKKEHVFKEHLESLAKEHPKLKLQICYSNPSETCVAGRDYQHKERVSVDLFKKILPSNNYDFYLCGPPPMMKSVVEGLEAWGVPEDKVHFEAFGPASVKKVSKAAPLAEGASDVASIEVTFGRSGKKIAWKAGAGTLLELAEGNGVSIPSGCRAGNCGTCVVALKSGEIKYTTEPGTKPEEGSCLTCVTVPKGPVVLDA